MIRPFENEPVLSYQDAERRRLAKEALDRVRRRSGEPVALWVDGEPRVKGVRPAHNPSNPEEVIGQVSQADEGDSAAALDAATRHFAGWRRMPALERAMILLRAAAGMRRERYDLVATEVIEAGKPWPEADGDVAEAIDFLEYYARQMVRLAGPVPVEPTSGEWDEAFYVPLGPGVIIPPWNFPLAILAGMTSAALVSGNTVVLKPASPTPLIAARFVEVMHDAGLPRGVLQFLPGPGGRIGDALVADARTRFISFTGSRDVGLHIVRTAADTAPGQRWIKKVVAEMGGKDAIIVDADADLEAASAAIVTSAFGYQGQKCSACSRAIIVDSVYDEVLERVTERTKALKVGPAEAFDSDLGPVINQSAFDKIRGYIEAAPGEGARLAAGGGTRPGGYFLEPTVFAGVSPDSRLGQEEVFGPVLAVMRARDFDHALEIANGTEYGLTGSVYARDRAHLAKARVEFEVGNLYFNRRCTGALVGAHPFGGFNMSGTDSKTGSADYLLLFMQMKAVAERF